MRTVSRVLPLLALGLAWPVAASAACPVLASAQGSTTGRVLTARDLIELRDIGDPDSPSFGQPSRIAISPDGTRVAFAIMRGDLATNGYCLGVFVMAIAPGAFPRQIDAGGDLLPAVDNLRGNLVDSGGAAPVIPAWSPDGRWLAFLRRDRGVTQLWVAAADGSRSRAVTRSASDITQFAWAGEGRTLLFATHPALVERRTAAIREG